MRRLLLIVLSLTWGVVSFVLSFGYLFGIALNCKGGCSGPFDGFFQLGIFHILVFLTIGLPGLLSSLLLGFLLELVNINSTPEIFPIFAILNSILSSVLAFLIIKGIVFSWRKLKS